MPSSTRVGSMTRSDRPAEMGSDAPRARDMAQRACSQRTEEVILVAAVASGAQTAVSRRMPRVLELLVAAQGAAFVILVGIDGSEVGRSLRVVAVLAVTGLGVLCIRRAGPVGRGATALALGIVGTVVGAGVSAAYVTSVGISLITIAAAVALVTGLSLLGTGAAILTRRLNRWWRLLAGPAALVVVVFALYPLTMAVNATNRPATPLSSETPEDRGLSYEDVVFSTSDGVQLSAWYVPSLNGAAVVLLHGAGSTRSSVLAHGVVLARHGFGVLLLDTRGHGLSDGDAMDFGWYGDIDIGAAVSFLEARPDVTQGKIGLVGLSMGGEQAIAAAGVDDRIRAVVAEGVTGMQTADHGWVERYGLPGSVQLVIDRVMYGAADLLSDADLPMSLREAISSAAPHPLLLIAGGDTASEEVAGHWFEQASPDSVELWVVPEAGHIAGLAVAPAGWEARVIEFLDASLGPARGNEAA